MEDAPPALRERLAGRDADFVVRAGRMRSLPAIALRAFVGVMLLAFASIVLVSSLPRLLVPGIAMGFVLLASGLAAIAVAWWMSRTSVWYAGTAEGLLVCELGGKIRLVPWSTFRSVRVRSFSRSVALVPAHRKVFFPRGWSFPLVAGDLVMARLAAPEAVARECRERIAPGLRATAK